MYGKALELLSDWLQEALFLERSNSLSRKCHSDFLAVDNKCLLLKIWLKNPLCATQREAHVVAELFALTGKFAACCHFFTPLYLY